MGRPEGPGCYCAANNMLRAIVDTIADGYPWVVIDNEAGLEHLSRRTTRDVDVLFVVSDATVRGIITAGRVRAILDELQTRVGQHYLIVNRAAEGLTPELESAIVEQRLELLAVLPSDPLVAALDASGRPISELPADSPLKTAFAKVLDRLPIDVLGKEAARADHR
jgi:CO dehydrogenase maturation factor